MIGDSALESGRIRAESRMKDHCIITVPGSGEPVYDPDTNTSALPEPVPVYPTGDQDGRCRIRVEQLSSDRPTVAVDDVTVVNHIISIPVGAAEVPRGATITITTSRHDPFAPGRRYTVRSHLGMTEATAYRMQCEEVQLEVSS